MSSGYHSCPNLTCGFLGPKSQRDRAGHVSRAPVGKQRSCSFFSPLDLFLVLVLWQTPLHPSELCSADPTLHWLSIPWTQLPCHPAQEKLPIYTSILFPGLRDSAEPGLSVPQTDAYLKCRTPCGLAASPKELPLEGRKVGTVCFHL